MKIYSFTLCIKMMSFFWDNVILTLDDELCCWCGLRVLRVRYGSAPPSHPYIHWATLSHAPLTSRAFIWQNSSLVKCWARPFTALPVVFPRPRWAMGSGMVRWMDPGGRILMDTQREDPSTAGITATTTPTPGPTRICPILRSPAL